MLWIADPAHAGDLPRFVSLKSTEANLRAGPGTQYPIKWIYRRASLPVEIIDEYGHWRKIRDMDGEQGWMHKGMLSGTRTAIIMGKTRALKRKPETSSVAILKAEPTVVGKILECEAAWCRLDIKGRRGWIQKQFIWGVYKNEVIGD